MGGKAPLLVGRQPFRCIERVQDKASPDLPQQSQLVGVHEQHKDKADLQPHGQG